MIAAIPPMALEPGHRLGHYEVAGLIGVGGMGEVYRATDANLKRAVAIKVLPASVSADPDRLARFQREAEILATLNHPNVAAIYGFEKAAGLTALVMELVEGTTLADRIAQGPIPLDEGLAIARQIADALEAAHERGIIHRDLKPANVKVREDGSVKVLDFGLAKIISPDPAGSATSASQSMSPTLSVHATMQGVILGTAAYMSPEQARGRAVDRRTDIWAFGCVLFEMTSGSRPFDGDDIAETIGAVIHKDPPWEALPTDTPARLRTVLQRCLEKDPKRRLRDVGDVQLALGGAFDTAASTTTPDRLEGRRTTRRWLAIAASVVLASIAITGATAWWLLRPQPVPIRPARFTFTPPPSQPLILNGFFRQLAISADGARIAYVTNADNQQLLMIRQLDRLDVLPLRGATGGFPFFSPDGQWVGFFTASGELRKVAVAGGSPITICRFQGTPRGATWGPDNTIIFATNDTSTGLLSVPATGGDPSVLTRPDRPGDDHLMPVLTRNGRAVLYTIGSASGSDDRQVAVLDLGTGHSKTLVRGGSDATYVEISPGMGYLLYASAGALHAVRFDVSTLEVSSEPFVVVDELMTTGTGAAYYAVSNHGTLVYVAGDQILEARSLVWVSRDGSEQPLGVPSRSFTSARLSPDERHIALGISDQENDVWIHDVSRGTTTRLTTDGNVDTMPIWSPDGQRIVFASGREGPLNIYSQAANGSGTIERLTTSPYSHRPSSFSPDGQVLVFQQTSGNDATFSPDLMLLRLKAAPQVEMLLRTPFAEFGGEISPDGRWIVYHSDESGRGQPQVFVRPFPNVDAGRWHISNDGGSRAAWSKDGRELFYLNAASALMGVPIVTTPSFSAGTPTKLFDGPWYGTQQSRTYDTSRDGRRWLMIKATPSDPTLVHPTLTVVLNWFSELNSRFPSPP